MSGNRLRFTTEYIEGKEKMKNSSLSICSIVRDCGMNLKNNIPRIELLRTLFKDSEVIVFENDSKDNTLEVLRNWERSSSKINIFSEVFNSSTIPTDSVEHGNRYFSKYRIGKMVTFRNKYLHFLNNNGINRDYVIIIDLDISNFDIDGIIHSFGMQTPWDCISANGISLSSRFVKQYHDSYALIEHGRLNDVQTEQSIRVNRIRYSAMKTGQGPLAVDSAFGGLAVYKWNSIKDLYYSCLDNNDDRVQCKSEHVGLHKMMKDKGHFNIYINPAMKVKYRSVTPAFLISKAKEKFKSKN
jgi:hypothetical protein